METFDLLSKLDRVDFALKDDSSSAISQYVTSLTSHTGYWESEDVMFFILKRLRYN